MANGDFQEPHLKDYIDILKRRWLFLLTPLLVIPLWQGIPVLNSHPTYESTATVQLEPEKGFSYSFAQSFSPEFLFLNERWTNNQMNIIKGKAVAEKVVKKLGLRIQMHPEERVYQSLMKIWISDFPAALKAWNSLTRGTILSEPFTQVVIRPIQVSDDVQEGYYRGTFQDSKHFAIFDSKGMCVGKGTIGQLFEGQKFFCQVDGVGRKGKSFEFHIIPELAATLAVQSSMVISPIKETSLIEVGVRWNEPKMARDIANAVVDAYQEAMVSKKAEDISQVLSFIDAQLRIAEEDLHKAEQNLSKFKGKEKVVNFDAQIKETLDQATQYAKELNALAIQRKQAEIVLSALNSSREFNEREALFSLGAGLNDSLLLDFGRKLSDLRIQKAALLTLYKEGHPKIQQIEQEMESIKKNIMRGVRGLISSLKIKENAFQMNLEKLERKIRYIPATEQELYSLQRMVKVSAGISEFLLQKRAELSVNKAGIVSNVYVVDTAVIPRGFVRTELLRTILLALLFGGALGIGVAFLAEYFDSSVKTPEQIQNMIDLPYLGTIYHFHPQNKTYKEELQMLEAPYSHIAESFRTIKTNLIFAASVGDPKKFILITSSAPSEGKTFVTANLGVALAQSGKRVLLVEADLRNPFLHEIFGTEKSPGLTNAMLNGQIGYPDLPIRATQVENLELMPSGDNPPNPSELLCSEKMEMVFSILRDQYDFVLFDSPPVFLTSDPIILAQRVDGVIIVTRSGETKKDVFKEAVERLLRVEAKILGILFNDMHKEGKKYYYKKYGKYYGKYYGRYYGKSVEKDRIN